MAVARSYENLPIVKEPYFANGRQYVQVQMLNGSIKQVRWYSDAEYAKYYGAAAKAPSKAKTQREALGFGENGQITIFKGNTYACKDWFKENGAKYTRAWGWAFANEVPADLPAGVEAMTLLWDVVGNPDGSLKTEEAIKAAIDAMIYEPDASEFVGEVGQRIEFKVRVEKAIELNGYYGRSIMHILRGIEDGNVYVWTTASKSWAEGAEKTIRGTIKDHRTYRNVNQTILTRCMEVGVK